METCRRPRDPAWRAPRETTGGQFLPTAARPAALADRARWRRHRRQTVAAAPAHACALPRRASSLLRRRCGARPRERRPQSRERQRGSIFEDAVNAFAFELRAAVERDQLDEECHPVHLSAELL